MKLFTVKLTDEERARLEAHRARLGLRSQAEVIRAWIAMSTTEHVPALVSARMLERASENIAVDRKVRAKAVPVGPVAPKPGSRLKGTK
jgi:hypothetical protein